MVGRLYTIEDEIDVIHEDLGRARRYLNTLRSDPDQIRRATERVYRRGGLRRVCRSCEAQNQRAYKARKKVAA